MHWAAHKPPHGRSSSPMHTAQHTACVGMRRYGLAQMPWHKVADQLSQAMNGHKLSTPCHALEHVGCAFLVTPSCSSLSSRTMTSSGRSPVCVGSSASATTAPSATDWALVSRAPGWLACHSPVILRAAVSLSLIAQHQRSAEVTAKDQARQDFVDIEEGSLVSKLEIIAELEFTCRQITCLLHVAMVDGRHRLACIDQNQKASYAHWHRVRGCQA